MGCAMRGIDFLAWGGGGAKRPALKGRFEAGGACGVLAYACGPERGMWFSKSQAGEAITVWSIYGVPVVVKYLFGSLK